MSDGTDDTCLLFFYSLIRTHSYAKVATRNCSSVDIQDLDSFNAGCDLIFWGYAVNHINHHMGLSASSADKLM